MRQSRVYFHIRFFLAALSLLLLFGADGRAGNYEVTLSWFIDIQQFNASAHSDLFCVDCHSSVAERPLHPNPDDVTRPAADFFDNATCASAECHEDILQDQENGIHGRIRFKNREKYAFCIDCHDPHRVGPAGGDTKQSVESPARSLSVPQAGGPSAAERESNADCLACHSLPADPGEAARRETALCFQCHSNTSGIAGSGDYDHLPKIDPAAYHGTAHAGNRCSDCHAQSITYGHVKTTRECASCHVPHHESETHDAHVRVTCRACHLQGGAALDRASGLIDWKPPARQSPLVTVHQLLDTESEESCLRCHTPGNEFGAADMVLPAKGIFCMACHTATFSVSDATTGLTLFISLLVFLGFVSLWLSAGLQPAGEEGSRDKVVAGLKTMAAAVFSRAVFRILKALLLDAVIQRRLLLQSPFRWFSHGLIFYSFLLRFGWGLISLVLSLAAPEWPLTRALLDKNQPWVAFVFDLTGVLIILGMILMAARKLIERRRRWPGLPRQEWLSMALIGGIIVVGFVLEGIRIAMTLDHPGKHFAFFGYAISLLFNNMEGLTEIYGYVWYLHAIMTAAFIIWLPFSRMFHIVMGPVVVAVNSALKHDR